ncbi:helix-turn-helix domain-containing protein [Rahnella sp. ChDrAdgB13]|uniref:helix-turn-helix domain-containing protein n=1 Tax=Rahnella sp. ChDrAdgB13 TaxID=1850581 RepID=UPI001FCC10B8|nr:helix-turn-helix domain-containing protein [Rahnella sp. ChDrAdgB13]
MSILWIGLLSDDVMAENMKESDIKTGGYKEKTGDDAKNRERIIVSSGINRFSERLKEAMSGMSNSELARRCGMSETTIRKYLKGAIYPGIDSAAIVAHACDVSLIWLLCGTEQKVEEVSEDKEAGKIDIVLRMLSDTQRNALVDAILEHGVTGIMSALNGMADITDFLQLTENERAQVLRVYGQIREGAAEGDQRAALGGPITDKRQAS